MVPKHGRKAEEAFREPSEAPPCFGASPVALSARLHCPSARGLAQSKTATARSADSRSKCMRKNESRISRNELILR